MKFEIKNRWNGSTVYACELSAEIAGLSYGLQLGFAVKKALAEGSDLSGSDLRGSNLRGSNLRGSDLSGSNLSGSNLSGSDLSGSDLSGSDLSGSNLSGSNLRCSNLRGSNLRGSDLSGSDLSGSDLSAAKNIPEDYYILCRDDLWAVLSAAPREVGGLRAALVAGRVDGSTYEGACACLVGTIANVRGGRYDKLEGIKPNSSRPIERFFMQISRGDTPETNDAAKRAVEWLDTWVANVYGTPVTQAPAA